MKNPDTPVNRDYRASSGQERIPTDLENLEMLDDWELGENEPDPRGYDLIGRDGEKIGTIRNLLASPSMQKAYFAVVETGNWLGNRRYAVPLHDISFDTKADRANSRYVREQFRQAPEYGDGNRDFGPSSSYWSRLAVAGSPKDTAQRPAAASEMRVPVMEETAEVRKERRETGFITVRKRVDVETKHISEPVMHTRVVTETREVPAGETYERPASATVLKEGQELRVPVVEEVLVVDKQARVAREVVIQTRPEVEQVERDVELRREKVEVDEEGDVEVEHLPPRR